MSQAPIGGQYGAALRASPAEVALDVRRRVVPSSRQHQRPPIRAASLFTERAQECQQMASSARDVVDKATWSQTAEPWQAYAKYYQDQLSALEIQVNTRWRKTH